MQREAYSELCIILFSVLDIDDDLNAELFDDLLDTVLNEIKAKQGTNTKDSDDQIMPTASPNIYVSLSGVLFLFSSFLLVNLFSLYFRFCFLCFHRNSFWF